MTRILAITCMRNEGPYCLEWIAHHRAAGVDAFLIFTHDCDDGTDALLDLIPGVTHVPFMPEPGKSVQWQAMRLADGHPLMQTADWVIFFDCDEFLSLEAPLLSFGDLIASVPTNTDAIALPWRFFGAAGREDFEDRLTPERFTRCAPDPFFLPAGNFFKTLFRPERFQKLGVHRPKNKGKGPGEWNLGGVAQATAEFAQNDSRINLFGLMQAPARARLHHYSLRSAAEFMVKRGRGLPNRTAKTLDLHYWAERNFNSVEDHMIDPMLDATRHEIANLRTIKPVQDAHDHAVRWHRAAFAALMNDPAEVQVYWHLILLGSSTPPSADQARAHLARHRQAGQS
ncbi:glycosyltransferase family 2 protein [Roseobacter sp. GAI101]|uniref:glycosyltransferase family 2 protein n=1 Tax=Roseobacter sp. (strain GAI101) TaxID=391589 RepID=UPI000187187D|nr:glycosyltransferase family 2 protein [Roseobacter sp. GAI101]EEB85315.1 glycosyl transferase, group 2 family [Roseobacter sp. GAI101]